MIIDLETYALDAAAEFIEEPTAPANYKDPDKIAAYIKDATSKAISRCALDPDLCRIVAIGWSHEDGRGCGVEIAPNEGKERALLAEIWFSAAKIDRLVGFNLLAFDLPVMIRRSQYLGIEIPSAIVNLDRYRTPHIDLMERLSFNGKIKAHSLNFYCKRFGIEVDDPSTGADIDALVKANDWDAVAAHCRADVDKTRQLAERLRLIQPVPEAVTL